MTKQENNALVQLSLVLNLLFFLFFNTAYKTCFSILFCQAFSFFGSFSFLLFQLLLHFNLHCFQLSCLLNLVLFSLHQIQVQLSHVNLLFCLSFNVAPLNHVPELSIQLKMFCKSLSACPALEYSLTCMSQETGSGFWNTLRLPPF